MAKSIMFVWVVFFLLGFPVRLFGQKISEVQNAKICSQIDSVFQVSIKAADRLDLDQLSLGVDDSHQAGFISKGTYFTRYDSLISNVKAGLQNLSNQIITVRKKKITVLSQSIVLLTAYGDALVTLKDGNTFVAGFFWTFVYEKSGNEWKVIQSHQSGSR